MTDPRLDELRDALRARGYLDARLDRFVLGGAARKARPLGVAVAASVRIGLIAAALLGPAAAIGLRSRAPTLVTNLTDAIVSSVYLGALFWVAATVASVVAVLAGAAVARRMAGRSHAPRRFRRAAAGAGVLVGLACLAYLTLWWRTTAGLAGATSPVMSLAVIAVAVAIALILGHAVSVTVLACLVRLGLTPDAGRPPLSSAKSLVLLGSAALAGAMALLVAAGPGRAVDPAPPRLVVVPTGFRVVVLAVDGVDPATLDRLRAGGRVPTFDRLLGQAVGTLPADTDRDPARVWTTVATGQPPERHGIRALESREVAGLAGRVGTDSPVLSRLAAITDVLRLTRPAIASGAERLIPAFWEVAARAGFRTAVVHWWATWPAPPDLGIVLSDRAILRLEHGGPLDGEIAPASLYESLAPSWVGRRAPGIERAARLASQPVSADLAAVLRRSAELDATIVQLAREPDVLASDLIAVYLPGLDIAQSALMSTSPGLAPAPAIERAAALESYYEFLDGLLADLLSGIEPGNRVDVLVALPGRAGGASGGRLAVSGQVARATETALAPTAVAPTVLYALGLPVATDLASPPATDLFEPALTAADPVRVVDTYGSRAAGVTPRTSPGLDREMIERMRSLGYVR